MSEIERTARPRRIAKVAAPFGAGAVAGAALLAGLGFNTGDIGTTSTAATQPVTSSRQVATTRAQYDAEAIYERTSPGVVHITVTQEPAPEQGLSPFTPGDGTQQARAQGTGFVYDEDGHIVTAAHVVDGAGAISVRFSDGTTADATLVGTDPSSDVAVIDVDVAGDELTPLAFADSSSVAPGQGVVAIGSPFGLEESITAGIVSAVGRDIEAPNGYTIANAIQTDAAINHGNSGGPLIDEGAEVVGVNVQIKTSGQGDDNAGVGFAVPSNTAKEIVDDVIAGRDVEHAYLGVALGDDPAVRGATVSEVRPGGPGADAGLEPGDVVVGLDGEGVARASDLTAAVAERKPGDELRLTVERGGETLDLDVTLGVRPETASA